MINIAINGFGRIGRAALKIIVENHKDLKVVAINDLTDTATLAQLLRHDSCYGLFSKSVSHNEKELIVNNVRIPVLAEKDPSILPWEKLKVDVVLECTGKFLTKVDANKHLQAGAKKVVMSAPAKDDTKTYVIGVNEDKILKTETIISCASCTTNCLAPVMAILKQEIGIKKAIMTTTHSYTADQNLVDGPHKDLRRARAAALNIVPTTTGAAKSVTETIPSLKDKFDGLALRVPTPVGSICDIICVTTKKVNADQVNKVFQRAAKSARYKHLIDASFEPLVSTDIIGRAVSATVDLSLTKVVDSDLLQVIAWYDNEWGYSNRLVELAKIFTRK
jgi:glyceraldehyde 3-phosphate dehydrogenase